MIMDFPDPMDNSIVYVDTPTSILYIEDEEEVREFNVMFSRTQSAALSPTLSMDLVKKVIKSLEE